MAGWRTLRYPTSPRVRVAILWLTSCRILMAYPSQSPLSSPSAFSTAKSPELITCLAFSSCSERPGLPSQLLIWLFCPWLGVGVGAALGLLWRACAGGVWKESNEKGGAATSHRCWATESSCPARVSRGWLLWEQLFLYGEARRRGSRE